MSIPNFQQGEIALIHCMAIGSHDIGEHHGKQCTIKQLPKHRTYVRGALTIEIKEAYLVETADGCPLALQEIFLRKIFERGSWKDCVFKPEKYIIKPVDDVDTPCQDRLQEDLERRRRLWSEWKTAMTRGAFTKPGSLGSWHGSWLR